MAETATFDESVVARITELGGLIVAPETETEIDKRPALLSALQSIYLPPLFPSDFVETLGVDSDDLSRLVAEVLSAEERAGVAALDLGYVRSLHRFQIDHSQQQIDEGRQLAFRTKPSSRAFLNWYQAQWAPDREVERDAAAQAHVTALRAESQDGNGNLLRVLESVTETFDWSPGPSDSYSTVERYAREPGRIEAHTREVVGAQPDDKIEFYEVADFYGVLYNVYSGDPNPANPTIWRTDHETAFRPDDLSSEGSLSDFLTGFSAPAEIVSMVSADLTTP